MNKPASVAVCEEVTEKQLPRNIFPNEKILGSDSRISEVLLESDQGASLSYLLQKA